jgi:hypothetical protein
MELRFPKLSNDTPFGGSVATTYLNAIVGRARTCEFISWLVGELLSLRQHHFRAGKYRYTV